MFDHFDEPRRGRDRGRRSLARGGGRPERRASGFPVGPAGRALGRALAAAACVAFAASCQVSNRPSATEELLRAELERTRSELQRKCRECDGQVEEANRLRGQLEKLRAEVEALKARLASGETRASAPPAGTKPLRGVPRGEGPPQAPPEARPLAGGNRRKLVLFDGYAGRADSRQYSKLQVEAAKAGASLTLSAGRFPELGQFGGAIVVGGAGGHNHTGYDGLEGAEVVKLHGFVRSGGRLAFFVLPRMSDFNTTLQDTFRVTIALEDVTPRGGNEMHLEGAKLCGLWKGLTVGALADYKDRSSVSAPALCSYFVPLDQGYGTTLLASAKTKKQRATSVEGALGAGRFLFITNVANGGGGCLYRTGSTPVADRSFDAWDNQEAARRLVAWLAGE